MTGPSDPHTDARRTAATQRVVDAAILLFARAGFLATSIRDLTSSCGLTPASFYSHFGSKEQLLYDIVTEANAELECNLDKLDLGQGSPVANLFGLVRALVTFNLTNPRQARIANREYVFLSPPMLDEVVDHRRRVRTMFETVLTAMPIERGLVSRSAALEPEQGDTETRLLAISIINLSIASSEWYRPDGPLTADEVADTYCRLALRMAGMSAVEPPPTEGRTPRRKARAPAGKTGHSAGP
jgi:AcrR family transcriptional regulator